LAQPFGPLSEALDRKAEVAEQRGIPENHAVSGYRRGDARPRRFVEPIDLADVNVALAGAVENRGAQGTLKAGGQTGCQREHG
jgi:hypothetical protein